MKCYEKVLITGFDPFGGEKINPAYEAVKLLPDEIGGAKSLRKKFLQYFKKGQMQFMKRFKRISQILIVYWSSRGGRSQVTPEWVGINFRNAENLPIMKAINLYRQVL